MVIFDGFKLIGLALMVAPLIICGIIVMVDRLVYAVNNRSKRRKNGNEKE